VRTDVGSRVRELAREAEHPLRLPYMTELYVGFKAGSRAHR
jgi:hypothetical protein